MKIETYDKITLCEIINSKIDTVGVALDIGCGIRPQTMIRPLVHICAEPYQQYIDKLNCIFESRSGAQIVLKTDWEGLLTTIPDESVDTVFLLDVIEHIDKEYGRKLLALTENKVRRQIVLFTPLGFMPQYHPDGKDAWGLDGGAYQEHKSGWTPEDFSDDWDIYLSKEFHFTDNLGKLLEKPYGAFYAIYNKREKAKSSKQKWKYWTTRYLVGQKILMDKLLRVMI